MKQITKEIVQHPERFQTGRLGNPGPLQETMEFALGRIDKMLPSFTEKFPASSSVDLVYPAVENGSDEYGSNWTHSFWTGMLWLAYEMTGKETYKALATQHSRSFKQRLEENVYLGHHDIGFLYSLSCVADYKITGHEDAKHTALQAAYKLGARYLDKSKIIQVRDSIFDPTQPNSGVMIIDCSLNIPLLYWAAEVSGDRAFYTKAYNHIQQVVEHIIREDGSSFQCFQIDPKSGEPVKGWVAQGHDDSSCWARGQAWGIYGLALSYAYTGDTDLLEACECLTNYFLNRLPDDLVCNWDLKFLEDGGQRDSSAAAIAVCGMLELVKHLPLSNPNRELYENAALAILQSLSEHYTQTDKPDANGLIQHGVYVHRAGLGLDEYTIWGDYFYLEALLRTLKPWRPYW